MKMKKLPHKMPSENEVIDYWTKDAKLTLTSRVLLFCKKFYLKYGLAEFTIVQKFLEITSRIFPSTFQKYRSSRMRHLGSAKASRSHQTYRKKIPVLFKLGKREIKGNAMDWGSGDGSFSEAWGKNFKRVVGVDIAKSTLAHATKNSTKLGVNFEPLLYDAKKPIEPQINVPKSSLDLFTALAVYMHFPSTKFGQRVTELAFSRLKKGGLALININTPDSHAHKNKIKFHSNSSEKDNLFLRTAGVERKRFY